MMCVSRKEGSPGAVSPPPIDLQQKASRARLDEQNSTMAARRCIPALKNMRHPTIAPRAVLGSGSTHREALTAILTTTEKSLWSPGLLRSPPQHIIIFQGGLPARRKDSLTSGYDARWGIVSHTQGTTERKQSPACSLLLGGAIRCRAPGRGSLRSCTHAGSGEGERRQGPRPLSHGPTFPQLRSLAGLAVLAPRGLTTCRP